jgi:serine/threonine protein kinase
MADVFLARLPGREGAAGHLLIKRLYPHLAEEPEEVEVFRSEALIAGNLHHPHIARIHEFGQVDGYHYIAREFVHGADLGMLLRRARNVPSGIPQPLALRIMAAVCDALDCVHRRTDGPPMHGEMDPGAVLIGFEGSVKLIGFRRPRVYKPTAPPPGMLKRNVAFLAPEQFLGKAQDHRVDVFTAGLLLYALLTGASPLKRDSQYETVQALMDCAFRPPSQVVPTPPELDPVVMRALARAPDERYRDAGEFRRALEGFLEARGWAAQSRPEELARFMRALFADLLEG